MMPSPMRSTIAAALLLLGADAPLTPRDCASTSPIAGGDEITAVTCDDVRGFFVSSDYMRRSGGVAEAIDLRPVHEAKIAELEEMVRRLSTATTALAGAVRACDDKATTYRLLYDGERADRATCMRAIDDCAQGSTTRVLVASGIGLMVGAGACIGTAHALPQAR